MRGLQITLMQAVSTGRIRQIVMDGRKMKVLPTSVWRSFDWAEVRMLLHETGTYVIPTEELINYLVSRIGQERAIEICAGNGYIGRELGITMTDSYQQQDDPATVAYYEAIGQPRIRYPKDVLKYEANKAVSRFRPHTVLGCYATHRWRDDTHSGNIKGVDFERLLHRIKRLILVGNKVTHADNPIMVQPHEEIHFPWLLTRATNQEDNRIFIWQ